MFHSAECTDALAAGGPPLAVVVVAGFVVVGAVVVGLAVVVVTAGFVVVGFVVVVEVPPPLQAATSDNTTSNPATMNQGASLFVTMLLSLLSILTYQLVKLLSAKFQNATRGEGLASLTFYTKCIVFGRDTSPISTLPPHTLPSRFQATGRSGRTENRYQLSCRCSAPKWQLTYHGTGSIPATGYAQVRSRSCSRSSSSLGMWSASPHP